MKINAESQKCIFNGGDKIINAKLNCQDKAINFMLCDSLHFN